MTGCSVQRSATCADTKTTTKFTNVTNERDSVVVATRDTLKEVTTVTVQLDAVGDTVKVSTVTDRTRASVRDRVKEVEVRTEVRVDTVYVERRDSILVKSEEIRVKSDQSGKTTLHGTLKWVFWIVVAVTVLIVVVKVSKILRV